MSVKFVLLKYLLNDCVDLNKKKQDQKSNLRQNIINKFYLEGNAYLQ